MTTDELIALPQYSLPQAAKEERLVPLLADLHARHTEASEIYARVTRAMFPEGSAATSAAQLPWIPVGLFKSHRLVSVPDDEIFKTLTSSGTTGASVSHVYLDRQTAQRQTEALAAIMTTVLGRERLPMLIVDWPGVISDRAQFSARGAGILGMINFGRRPRYLLDQSMNLDREVLKAFVEEHGGQPFLIFGFTFMVWRHFLQEIAAAGLDLSNGILIHSGGWKALEGQGVDDLRFREAFKDQTGLTRVHNFYGMVEQVGSVFLQGPDGLLHPPNFADVIVRDPVTWQELPIGQVGVVQVLSALPWSYPGHSILTEDLGIVHGVDDGPPGWLGKRFSLVGRIPHTQLRGCSDIYAVTLPSMQPTAEAA